MYGDKMKLIVIHHFLQKGQNQSGGGSGGDKKDDKDKKKKYEPPIPTRVGKKKRKAKGPDAALKLPQVTPHTKCRLKLLKLERIKDYLLMEEEFIRNQERLKPQEEKIEEERSKVSLCTHFFINFLFPLCIDIESLHLWAVVETTLL